MLVDVSYRSGKKNDRGSVRRTNFNFLSCSIWNLCLRASLVVNKLERSFSFFT